MADYMEYKDQKVHEHLDGELLRLRHDFGKYSAEFQKYITDAIKKDDPEFDPDVDEELEDPTGKKTK